MTSVKCIAVLVVDSFAVLCSGCALRTATSTGRAESPAWTAPTWGPEAEGLQCRLRPVKRIWRTGEPPAFKVDLRNHGTRIFAFTRSADVPLHEFSVDGRWYRWPTPPATACRVWPLAPTVEFPDLPVTLPRRICGPLLPGRHTIQVAFLLEGVEVVSDPVGIEVTAPARQTTRTAQ